MAGGVVRGNKTSEGKIVRAHEFRRKPTHAEHQLWQALRGSQLCGLHFRRQQIINGFIADFYCHSAGLVVEVDGPVHDDRVAYDEFRSLVLTERRPRILRVRNDDVLADLPGVLARILCAAKQGKAPSSSPFPAREGDRS